MKTKKLILLFTLTMLIPLVSNAQFGKLVRNKASKALGSFAKQSQNSIDSTVQNAAPSANDSVTKMNQVKESQNTTAQGQG